MVTLLFEGVVTLPLLYVYFKNENSWLHLYLFVKSNYILYP